LARKGFRPFFLLAGAFGAAIVPLWLLMLDGHISVQSVMGAPAWHAHEMLFGYTAAVIAGFLLTAVANWTKRETAVGAPLWCLAALWLLGRAAMLLHGLLPVSVSAIVDALFLPVLAVTIARPIVQSGNKRNYVVVVVVLGFAAANALTHADAAGSLPGWGRRGLFGALYLSVLLMVLIAGRVIPMFTRNVLRDEKIRALPVVDRAALLAVLAVLVSDSFSGDARFTPALSALAGSLVLARTVHWGTRRTAGEPMLWILHVGHAWIAAGLWLKAFTPLWPPLASSSVHALTVGAIGCLTLGMMARVTLGHTGRLIASSRGTLVMFVLMAAAGVVRVGAPLAPAWYLWLLTIAGTLWTLSLLVFVVQFAPVLMKPRVDGAAG
jgi:uncharacterized protein involved in response to NO